MSRLVNAFAITLILLGAGRSSLLAQSTTGRIVGTVTDESGAVVPGVEVVVRNPATGLSRNVITNESGTYVAPLLPPALYEVEASLPGFRKEVRSGVTVQVEAVVRVDFALRVGDISDEIQVTADAPLVQSETASLGQVMDSRKVTDIPLNHRQIMSLTILTTGVQPVVEGSNLSTQNLSFHAMGSRERDNNFLLDGVDNNDTGNAQLVIVPSVDAIQEFKIQTSTYGAEFGRAGGGVLNIQTKSGTNDFRATVFEFLRNDIFDARNFFAVTKPPFRRNQFGTVVSGPIRKDRWFYMFNYEGARVRKTHNTLATVPSVRQRTGDFSELSRSLVDPLTRQPFPGNIIPANRIDPTGRAIAEFYPAPNRLVSGGSNYLTTAREVYDFDIITAKMDYRISDKQNFFVRFTWQDAYQEDPGFDRGAQLPKSGNVYFQPIGRNVAVSDTYVFGPRVVNEFRVGFNRLIGGIYEELYKQDFAKQIGIKGVQSQLYPHAQGYNLGWPRVTVNGYSGMVSGFSAQKRVDNTWHFFDMLAATRGNHQMKMGGEVRTMMLNVYIEGSANGTFTFDGRYSGNGFADLLLGYPARTQRRVGDPYDQNRSRAVSMFFQDDWKVTPALTLNLGVRWEMQTAPINRIDALSAFHVPTRQIVIGGKSGLQTFPNPVNRNQTITVAGGAGFGIPEGLFENDLNNYAPRFGFAWSPKAVDVVLRGGYGVFFTPDITAVTHTFRDGAFPWVLPQTFIADATRPNILLADPFPDVLAQGSTTAETIDTDFRNGYMQQWNLGIQRQLGSDMVLDVSYAGSKGTKLIGSRNLNQARLGPGSVDSRRPIPGWGSISQTERSIGSNYHSLQAKFERRLSFGLTFVSAYTWSHSIDYGAPGGTGGGGVQDANNLRAERGNSPWDIRHRLVNSYSYELPIGTGKHFLKDLSGVAATLLGGWQVAGITTFSTGQAFTPTVNGDISLTGTNSVRPNRIADGVLPRGQRSPGRWFDPAAFVIPQRGSFGNTGRGVLKGPGIHNWDLTLMKNTRIGEDHSVQFRAEFFNAINHPNFNLPILEATSPAFGTLTRAKDARQIQFGLKLFF